MKLAFFALVALWPVVASADQADALASACQQRMHITPHGVMFESGWGDCNAVAAVEDSRGTPLVLGSTTTTGASAGPDATTQQAARMFSLQKSHPEICAQKPEACQ